MIVESLELCDFRNYENLNINFSSGTNIFFGDNAQGKTNILESLYICGTSKSHKGSKDKEIISFDKEQAHIRIKIKSRKMSYKIDIHLRKNKTKSIAINGLPIKKTKELLGIIHFVFFSPEDLNIIKNGPSSRRKFIDIELCQLNNIYLKNLNNYNKVLEQRNALLKEIKYNESLENTLDLWDIQLCNYGNEVINSRNEFINELNNITNSIHKNITDSKENIKIIYEPDSLDLMSDLKKSRLKDIKFGSTSKGPHRDDFNVKINEIDIRKYGSQGQQRTSALSLKLAELYLVKDKIGENPVLLLDDVLSELDSNRQKALLNSINNIQTMITCTGLDDFVKNQFEINKLFKVVKGKVDVVKII